MLDSASDGNIDDRRTPDDIKFVELEGKRFKGYSTEERESIDKGRGRGRLTDEEFRWYINHARTLAIRETEAKLEQLENQLTTTNKVPEEIKGNKLKELINQLKSSKKKKE